jgi:hypothetical protein
MINKLDYHYRAPGLHLPFPPLLRCTVPSASASLDSTPHSTLPSLAAEVRAPGRWTFCDARLQPICCSLDRRRLQLHHTHTHTLISSQ